MGHLETRELKSVTAGVRQRGRWDVIGLGGDKWELEIQVIKDTVVDSSEPVELKLHGLGLEPFEESDFVIVEIRPLEDVKVPLALLSMSWRVVNVTGNGGLKCKVQDVCNAIWVLAPPRCSTKLSIGPVLCRTHDTRHPGTICRVTMTSGWQLLVYLHMDAGTTE